VRNLSRARSSANMRRGAARRQQQFGGVERHHGGAGGGGLHASASAVNLGGGLGLSGAGMGGMRGGARRAKKNAPRRSAW